MVESPENERYHIITNCNWIKRWEEISEDQRAGVRGLYSDCGCLVSVDMSRTGQIKPHVSVMYFESKRKKERNGNTGCHPTNVKYFVILLNVNWCYHSVILSWGD